MKKIIVLFFFGSFALAQNENSAQDLANAERSFSAASEKIGIKESFLQFLDDECVMFNPYPVNGKELYRKAPASTTHLTWHPSFVEVAASGDFGISSGPWEIRASKNDTPSAFGHYFSVWKKQSDGRWKVVLDNGIRYPKEQKRTEEEHVKNLISVKGGKHNGDAARNEILEGENAFIHSVKTKGIEKSYSAFAAENILVYRKGTSPSRQMKEAHERITKQQKQTFSTPLKVQCASSGDLGFTYGYAVDAKKDSSLYVRVWRKENNWKIAVDILNPFKN